MNPVYFLRRRFRMYKSFSRNPRRSMLADVASTALLMGIVAIAAWLSFSITRQKTPRLTATTTHPNTFEYATAEASARDPALETTVSDVNNRVASANNKILPTAKTQSSNAPNQLANKDDIFESNWIFLLPDDKFIVQLASSPDREQLYEDAKLFPLGPVAFYPFKLNPSNRIVYGYSTGVYASTIEATQAIAELPRSLVAGDPWIRPVSELKKQIIAAAN